MLVLNHCVQFDPLCCGTLELGFHHVGGRHQDLELVIDHLGGGAAWGILISVGRSLENGPVFSKPYQILLHVYYLNAQIRRLDKMLNLVDIQRQGPVAYGIIIAHNGKGQLLGNADLMALSQ